MDKRTEQTHTHIHTGTMSEGPPTDANATETGQERTFRNSYYFISSACSGAIPTVLPFGSNSWFGCSQIHNHFFFTFSLLYLSSVPLFMLIQSWGKYKEKWKKTALPQNRKQPKKLGGPTETCRKILCKLRWWHFIFMQHAWPEFTITMSGFLLLLKIFGLCRTSFGQELGPVLFYSMLSVQLKNVLFFC